MVGKSRLQQYLNYRIRVTLQDSRMLVGTLMAFDRHMNIVLGDCDEFRKIKVKGSDDEKEVKRTLGLVMFRGEHIVSLTAEAPPPAGHKLNTEVSGGVGKAIPGSKIVPIVPVNTGPIRGIGGPAPSMMMPPMGMNVAPPMPNMSMPPFNAMPPAGMFPPPPGMMPPPGM